MKINKFSQKKYWVSVLKNFNLSHYYMIHICIMRQPTNDFLLNVIYSSRKNLN
jgi:hypothetical protein